MKIQTFQKRWSTHEFLHVLQTNTLWISHKYKGNNLWEISRFKVKKKWSFLQLNSIKPTCTSYKSNNEKKPSSVFPPCHITFPTSLTILNLALLRCFLLLPLKRIRSCSTSLKFWNETSLGYNFKYLPKGLFLVQPQINFLTIF